MPFCVRVMITDNRKKTAAVLLLLTGAAAMSLICLLAGPSDMSPAECISALMGKGSPAAVRIMRNIRLPRVIAAAAAGAGLSGAGLIMQTALGNPMASPSTLGVSNAAVFGANLSMLVFAGGLSGTASSAAEPYPVSVTAFVFAALSALLVLGLCGIRSFTPQTVVLAGIAAGLVWSAAATVIQFYATDTGLSAAVIWSFGDLGRATYKTDGIMLAVTAAGLLTAWALSWKYNALLSGGETAQSMGINIKRLRLVSLLTASLMTAVCVSFLGMIGFVGIICPHISKKLLGHDHRFSLPASAISGSILLLAADTLSRSIGNGSALPVGAVTSLLGAPFFIGIILSGKENERC